MEKYIIQKTQKIVSALYLITDLIKDNDSIKWEIREEGISLVSSSLMFDTTFSFEKEQAHRLFMSSSIKIISLLNISLDSNLISKMNVNIVIHEIESLMNYVDKEDKEVHPPGYILSDSFFATDTNPEESKEVVGVNISDKGQNKLLRTIESKGVVGDTKSKNNRSEFIVDLLKKNSNLTIKDFANVIKDCSEKTIQRELIALVKKGIVRRNGERRWSTYSLI